MGPFQLVRRDPVKPAGSDPEDVSRKETGTSQVRIASASPFRLWFHLCHRLFHPSTAI